MTATARAYLDWNGSAPLAPEASEAIAATLAQARSAGLNPSSPHAPGRRARALVEAARAEVGLLAGVAPEAVVFCSGATEAAASVLAQGWDTVVVSAIEHDCVRAAAAASGARVIEAPVTGAGVIEPDAVRRALAQARGRTLVAAMAANNETGAVQPTAEIAAVARAAGARLFADAAQAAGKGALDLDASAVDFASLSAHKLGGPTGVGAIVLGPGVEARPLLVGGGQEGRRRAGTENLLGIVGFGAAARAAARPERRAAWAACAKRRDDLEARLKSVLKDLVFFASGVHRLPQTSCVAAAGVSAQALVVRLDLAGVAVGAGSACSSGKTTPSHVLAAMGATASEAASALRVSFGPDTPEADLERFEAAYVDAVRRARR